MKVNEYSYLRRYEIQQKTFIRTTLDNRMVGSRRVKSEWRHVGGLTQKIRVASNTSREHAHWELTVTAFQPGKCLWILFTEAVLKNKRRRCELVENKLIWKTKGHIDTTSTKETNTKVAFCYTVNMTFTHQIICIYRWAGPGGWIWGFVQFWSTHQKMRPDSWTANYKPYGKYKLIQT